MLVMVLATEQLEDVVSRADGKDITSGTATTKDLSRISNAFTPSQTPSESLMGRHKAF